MQIVLTDDHVELLRRAASTFAPEPEEQDDFEALEHFINTVAEHPSAFPVTGRMAKSIKTRLRRAKGDAQPPSRKNKRKARQDKRMRTAKARRKNRAENAAAFNAAREKIEAELKEMFELQEERARRREYLAAQDSLPFEEVAELFELFDLPHVAKHLRDENALTPQQRLERAARDREEYGIGSNP